MNSNSLFAYQAILYAGTISNQQKQILDLLNDGVKRSSRIISYATGMDRTSVTGRITKLKEMKLLEVTNDICEITGKRVEFYTLVAQ